MKVLLIDDDASFLKVLGHKLLGAGFEVTSCSSGESALDLMRARSFRVIVTDYRMNGVSGLAVARFAKSRRPPIPVIMLTAYAGLLNSDSEEIPDRVFTKPVEFSSLVDAINGLGNPSREKSTEA